MSSIRLRWILLAAQLAVVGLVFYFIGSYIADLWPKMAAMQWQVSPAPFSAAIVLGLVCQGLLIVGWRLALSLVGSTISWEGAVRSQAVGQLVKYVPGKLLTLIGKVYLAKQAGAAEQQATVAMFIEVCLLTATGLLIGLVHVFEVLPKEAVLLLGLLIVGTTVGVFHPAVLPRAVNVVLSKLGRPVTGLQYRWTALFPLVLCYVATWVLWGVGLWLLAIGVGLEAPLGALTTGNALAWVVGFVSFIFPGGLGVREVVLAKLLAPAPLGLAMSIALASRAWLLAAELAWPAGLWLYEGTAHFCRRTKEGARG